MALFMIEVYKKKTIFETNKSVKCVINCTIYQRVDGKCGLNKF